MAQVFLNSFDIAAGLQRQHGTADFTPAVVVSLIVSLLNRFFTNSTQNEKVQ